MNSITASQEIDRGERFEFGQNWQGFLTVFTPERLHEAKKSLLHWLDRGSLSGLTFLDIGSGSGLFSLAAIDLGAKVHSFDFDEKSVACAVELRKKHGSTDWTVEQASVLDKSYMDGLPQFDIVYSWGVLHHTGKMWEAIDNACRKVKSGGQFFISIYNDQRGASRRWSAFKRTYCRSSKPIQFLMLWGLFIFFTLRDGFVRLAQLKNPLPFAHWHEYKRLRGMHYFYDVRDWAGGYPFEVAKPEEIFDFLKVRGFQLERLKTCWGGHGCNEFAFRRNSNAIS